MQKNLTSNRLNEQKAWKPRETKRKGKRIGGREMKKHGISHGAAVLVTIIASSLLVDLARRNIPAITSLIDNLSIFISETIYNTAGHLFYPAHVTILIFAVMLSVLWGIAFSWVHDD